MPRTHRQSNSSKQTPARNLGQLNANRVVAKASQEDTTKLNNGKLKAPKTVLEKTQELLARLFPADNSSSSSLSLEDRRNIIAAFKDAFSSPSESNIAREQKRRKDTKSLVR